MPIHKVSGGWQWGEHGKVYANRAGAERQAAAAHAAGYTGDDVAAAGIALRSPQGRLLFLKRSNNGDHPGTWCFPGGRRERGETPIQTAIREAHEEIGPEGEFAEGALRPIDVRQSFTTFTAEVEEEFTPILNEEHTAFAWAHPWDAPGPVHPGVEETLRVMATDSFDPDQPRDEEGKWTLSEVSAGAYPKNNPKSFLVHAMCNGEAVCGKIKSGHLAEYADPKHKEPTCPGCLKKWKSNPHMHDTATVRTNDASMLDFAGFYAPEKVGKTRRVTPEGYLILEGTPIARVGEQVYNASEINKDVSEDDPRYVKPNGQGLIVVQRLPEEVFHPEALASFEGKDYVIEHPPEGVDTTNWKRITAGHVQNIRQGEGVEDDLVLADIVVKDPLAIEYVNKYLPENSAGYRADYEAVEPGRANQRNIIGNHVAAVKFGRAGARVAVRDHAIQPEVKAMAKSKFALALRAALATVGVSTQDAEKVESAVTAVQTADGGDDDPDGKKENKYDKLAKDMKRVTDWIDARDAEREEEKKKEQQEKDARAAKDAEEASEKAKKATEMAQHEAVGDTLIEAEGPGHTINLGKTWKGSMTGDAAMSEPILSAVNARAEILVPGCSKLTADAIKGNSGTVLAGFLRSTLAQHASTPVGKGNVQPFLMNDSIDKLMGEKLIGVFNGAAQLARARNNHSMVRTVQSGRTTADGVGIKGPMTVQQINEQNKKFWADRAASALK